MQCEFFVRSALLFVHRGSVVCWSRGFRTEVRTCGHWTGQPRRSMGKLHVDPTVVVPFEVINPHIMARRVIDTGYFCLLILQSKQSPKRAMVRFGTAGGGLLLLLSALLVSSSVRAQGPSSWKCRMAGGAANDGCGLPYALSNFQGKRWVTA